jgi:uncharacterized membrane protein
MATTAVLDLLWLGVLAASLYKRELGHLMAPRVNWAAAAVFYLLYGLGVAYFTEAPTRLAAAQRGALLGLLVYGTYDLTNLAVLRGWTPLISAVDVAWGVFLTASAAAAAHRR